uniref:Protein kinase domain-containing protein n=1 Tax=Scylla olivacea TaxID=85551 RepID=A0A0P4W432_SCYOL
MMRDPTTRDPARNVATKRPAAYEEAPQQCKKKRKDMRGWRVTVLSPTAGKLFCPADPPTGQGPQPCPGGPAKKRTAEASPHQPKRLKKESEQRVSAALHAADERKTNHTGFKMPVATRHPAVKRRASPSPEPRLMKKAKNRGEEGNAHIQPASKLHGTDSIEERARRYLAHIGVRLLKEKTVRKMISSGSQGLGAGSYGSCCKGVDPHAGKEVVIKTFLKNALRSLVTEAKCLQRLQGHGMQRLVGVCLETRQLVTRFAGQTAADYFHSGACFTHALRVILQVARAVRSVNEEGYTHNDIKSNNVCVKQATSGPKATLIDLGLAEPVGTRGFYKTDGDIAAKQRKYPWIAPELLRDSHPCSAASDVFSVAWFILRVPGWQDRPVAGPAMWRFKEWVKKARRPLPEQRPSLDALIQVIKQLHTEMASSVPACRCSCAR